MKNAYRVSLSIETPDGRRLNYDMALDAHELSCLEPLPDFPDHPGAAFAAAGQIEARTDLAKRIGRVAAANACDVVEAIHAGIEPTRGAIERAKAQTRSSPIYARFGAGRY